MAGFWTISCSQPSVSSVVNSLQNLSLIYKRILSENLILCKYQITLDAFYSIKKTLFRRGGGKNLAIKIVKGTVSCKLSTKIENLGCKIGHILYQSTYCICPKRTEKTKNELDHLCVPTMVLNIERLMEEKKVSSIDDPSKLNRISSFDLIIWTQISTSSQ